LIFAAAAFKLGRKSFGGKRVSDAAGHFNDGAAYERLMGRWSQLVGQQFLDWIAPAKGLSWLDVGCGNGAFTEEIIARYAPAKLAGVDPSEGQLGYARTCPGATLAKFHVADAQSLLISRMPPDQRERVREALRGQLVSGVDGRVTVPAIASAVKGKVAP
jgi:SAM-dependent methyltransferase